MLRYGWEPPMLSHHTAKFCCLCVSGDIFLVIERQDSTCPRLDLPLLKSISKAHGTPYSHTKIQHIKTVICWCMQWRISDLGHRCLKEQLTELNKTFFASLSKNSVRKKDKKKMAMAKLFALHANPQKRQLQSALCYTQIQKESKKVCCKVFWFTSKRKKRNEILLETLKRVYNILPETKQLIDQNLTGIFAKENFSVEKAFFLFWF